MSFKMGAAVFHFIFLSRLFYSEKSDNSSNSGYLWCLAEILIPFLYIHTLSRKKKKHISLTLCIANVLIYKWFGIGRHWILGIIKCIYTEIELDSSYPERLCWCFLSLSVFVLPLLCLEEPQKEEPGMVFESSVNLKGKEILYTVINIAYYCAC